MKLQRLVPPAARKRLADGRHRVAARRAPLAVFVRIPKTASTTVIAALYRRGLAEVHLEEGPGPQPLPRFVSFGHATVEGLAAAGLLDPGEVRGRYTFAFVRNPYDRALSLYYHQRHHPDWPMFDESTTFREFLEAVRDDPRGPGAHQSLGLSTAHPQVSWLDGTPGGVRFVGRTEHIDADLRRLCDELGIRHPPARRANVNPRRRERDYREAYDPATRTLTEALYAEDLDRFGYEF